MSECRDYGMGGPLRIKISEVSAYLDLTRVVKDVDVDLFLRCIMTLDAMWVDNYYKEREKKDAGNRRK